MSLPVFINYLSEEDLTKDRLADCWNKCNLKNKSEHIDRLMRLLHKKLDIVEKIPKDDVGLMCRKYTDGIIKKMIPYTEPLIEEIDEMLVNPSTSIVFEKDEDEYVATGVVSMGKLYPLQLKHMNICVSNGWSFKTDNDNISCVFRKK